jgi:arylformamidase
MNDTVYLQYDQAALDAQYNNRGRVPEHADHSQRWQKESARVRAEFSCRTDIAYGDGPSETVDIFQARDGDGEVISSGAPVNVFFHGGYWFACDKQDFSFIARSLVPAGAALVMVNYGLIPTVSMDHLIDQCRRALAWVHANAHTFGGDAGNLHLSGHSAGGQLVAMMMADPEAPAIGSATSLSGVFEL